MSFGCASQLELSSASHAPPSACLTIVFFSLQTNKKIGQLLLYILWHSFVNYFATFALAIDQRLQLSAFQKTKKFVAILMSRDRKPERTTKTTTTMAEGNRSNAHASASASLSSSNIKSGRDEHQKPFFPARKFLGKLRLLPRPGKISFSLSSSGSSSNSSGTISNIPSPPTARPLTSPSNLSILEDLNQAPTAAVVPTSKAGELLIESGNLQILQDLQQVNLPTTPQWVRQQYRDSSTDNKHCRPSREEGLLSEDFTAEGDILDAIVYTTKELRGCAMVGGDENENAALRVEKEKRRPLSFNKKKGMKDKVILEDLASAEEEWIHDMGIKI